MLRSYDLLAVATNLLKLKFHQDTGLYRGELLKSRQPLDLISGCSLTLPAQSLEVTTKSNIQHAYYGRVLLLKRKSLVVIRSSTYMEESDLKSALTKQSLK